MKELAKTFLKYSKVAIARSISTPFATAPCEFSFLLTGHVIFILFFSQNNKIINARTAIIII